jgi:hypothetical protein
MNINCLLFIGFLPGALYIQADFVKKTDAVSKSKRIVLWHYCESFNKNIYSLAQQWILYNSSVVAKQVK